MALTAAQIDAAARSLDDAERTQKQVGLISLQYPDMDMEDAYAIQAAWMKLKAAAGRVTIGRKIGQYKIVGIRSDRANTGTQYPVSFLIRHCRRCCQCQQSCSCQQIFADSHDVYL